MDYDRAMLRVVNTDVFEVESLRVHVIELDGGTLPLPADRVGNVKIDLRTVERAVALIDRIGLAGAVEGGLELGLGMIPRLDRAHEFLGPGRQLDRVLEPEVVVHALHQTEQALDLLADL